MPGYRQRGNSCGAYATTMALHELGRLPGGWSRGVALNIWGIARFLHSDHPDYSFFGYTNPVRLAMAQRSGVRFGQRNGIQTILTQPTAGHAIAACLQNGGPAMHYALVKKRLMQRTIQVYDSNWDELEWHDAARVPANLNDPVESLVTQAGRYSLQYTGLSVVLLA